MSDSHAEEGATNAGQVKAELLGSLGELLGALQAVSAGELTHRLDVRFPESHPVGALTLSINAMIEALREARTQSAAYSQELAEQLATIERQQAAIQELSTPIIEVWPGVLCVPIIGVLDSVRAAELTGTLLSTIAEKKAPYTVIDITGIEVMDTRTADHFVRMARSVRLLGARCVLCGIRPNIARTIVHMGVDLSGVDCYRTMREALRHYVVTTKASVKPSHA